MKHRFVLGAEQSRERVDKVLVRLLPDVSRATMQRWIAEERVLVDGALCRPKDVVGPGACVEVAPGPPPASRAEPDATVAIDVLFEDRHLIVVNKPAGVVVHPSRGHHSGTLVNGLLAREGFQRPPSDPLDPEGSLRPGIVHRLDKDTSGVLVVAKDEVAREGLKLQLAEHSVERVYLAITLGVPQSQTIDTMHGRHPHSRLKFSSTVREGRRAVTRLTLLERLAGDRCALVECRLETGRTHQIRVHLAERTVTPVLGDELYGGSHPSDPLLRPVVDAMGRHALHAAVLGFEHPVTGRRVRCEAPLPEVLDETLRSLRRIQ
jgi:23S rRNA pseudouridine1911/1915/1917 synthase